MLFDKFLFALLVDLVHLSVLLLGLLQLLGKLLDLRLKVAVSADGFNSLNLVLLNSH